MLEMHVLGTPRSLVSSAIRPHTTELSRSLWGILHAYRYSHTPHDSLYTLATVPHQYIQSLNLLVTADSNLRSQIPEAMYARNLTIPAVWRACGASGEQTGGSTQASQNPDEVGYVGSGGRHSPSSLTQPRPSDSAATC